MWKVNRSGQLVSMHQCKTDAIDFAMKHSKAKAVIVVVPKPTEGDGDEAMRNRVNRARRRARVNAEVERKEREHDAALTLPPEPNQPVEKNITKTSADEALPRPQ